MTEGDLQQISSELVKELTGKSKIQVEACFYKSRALNHKIKLEKGTIHIRIAEALQQAPELIIRVLITILVLKLYRYKVDRQLYRAYREYVERHPHLVAPPKTKRPSRFYQPEGRFFNLRELFLEINARFFENKLDLPILGWSLRKSYRRLGFYSSEKNLLVISRIFDAPKVPEQVVKFLLYHEMLHMAIPIQKINGRRRIHTTEFKRREQAFPEYEAIQKWLKKNLRKL